MNRKWLAISLLLLITAISSCKKCPCDPAQGLLPAFIGYSETDTDTLILRRYANTGNFSQLMDTLLVNEPLLNFSRKNDTLSPSYYSISLPMTEGNDYEIFLPAVNKTFRLSGIVEPKSSMPCGGIFSMDKRGCLNFIEEYTVNGVLIKNKPYSTLLYLK